VVSSLNIGIKRVANVRKPSLKSDSALRSNTVSHLRGVRGLADVDPPEADPGGQRIAANKPLKVAETPDIRGTIQVSRSIGAPPASRRRP